MQRTNTPLPAPVCALLALALGISACHDAAESPVALLTTQETRSALDVGEELPSLPSLISTAGMEGELTGAMDLWIGSWERPGAEEALELRERAYRESAAALARVLGHPRILDLHGRLGEAVAAIERLPEGDLIPEMRAGVATASEAHEEVAGLLERRASGNDAEALTGLLRASDALRAVGPEGVARTLVARAERALRDAPDMEGEAPDPDVERGDRLLSGARSALEEGDWTLAIRRAYYACQLLGVPPL